MKLIKKIIISKNKEKYEVKGSILKKIILGFLILVLIGVMSVFGFIYWLLEDLPSMDEIQNIQTSESTRIFDRGGKLLYIIHGDENRKVIPFDKITNETIYAVIALEDEKFFDHAGVSPKGIIRAILGQMRLMEFKGGGSTITQQFVKNKFLTSERTLIRKAKEAILSMQVENSYTKQDIITMYLNQIPFGSNIYGIEQAAKTFFGKEADRLSLAESAIIASIPNATTRYSPYGTNVHSSFIGIEEGEIEEKGIKTYEEFLMEYGADSIKLGLLPKKVSTGTGSTGFLVPGRSSHAINKMYELGFIKEEEVENAKNELAEYEFEKFREEINAPHFVMEVKKILVDKYGEEVLTKGGLKVYTSIDLELQEKAEKLVTESAKLNEEKFEAENQALLSVDVKTGEILTWVGSRDFFDEEIDGQVNVMSQRRLPGSTFKPFAYLAMMMNGYSPSTVLFDLETDFGGQGASEYKPQNFDGKFFGPLTMRKSLGNSRNITAIKAGLVGGIDKTYNIAKTLGIDFVKEADWYGASLPLGTADIKGTQLMQAYLVFANNGKKVELNPILKVIDKKGVILEEFKDKKNKEQLLDEDLAYQMTNMLSDPQARGAGRNSRLQLKGRENAVKTGTSNKSIKKPGYTKPVVMPADGWTIGFTPQIATVVWSGNNDGSEMSKIASGWDTSAKTWYDFMEEAHKDLPVLKFEKPEGIKRINISRISGLLPSENTPKSLITSGIFGEINKPKEYDNSIKFVDIDTVSKKLPTEDTPKDSIRKAAVLNMHSLRPDDTRWEGPVQKWLKQNAGSYLKNLGVNEILAKVPTEYDDIHTAENTVEKPEIKIITPGNNSKVSKNGFSVMPEITSKYKIIKVEYFLNGELINTAYNDPFIGFIEIGTDKGIGSKHEITAKVFDTIYNTGETKIKVEIGEDNERPYTEIVKPSKNQEIVAGSNYEVKTLTYDQGSDIDKIVFYVDKKKAGEKEKAPYSLLIKIPEEIGTHKLTVIAFDKSGNKSSDEVEFESIEKTEVSSDEIKIEIGRSLEAQIPEEIKLKTSLSKLGKLEKIELVARSESVTGEKINEIISSIENLENNSTGVFYINWIPKKGEYEVFTREYYKDRKVLNSRKINVTVD